MRFHSVRSGCCDMGTKTAPALRRVEQVPHRHHQLVKVPLENTLTDLAFVLLIYNVF